MLCGGFDPSFLAVAFATTAPLRRRLESVTWARSSSQFNAMSATVLRYRIPDDSTALSTPVSPSTGSRTLGIAGVG